MPTQTHPYLAISDGVTTLTIADGAGGQTSFPLQRGVWAPSVAPLRASVLGGRGPYEDVIEEIELHITGADAATAYSNLQSLNRLLDQAERWARGDYVNAVLLRFAPQGSTVSSNSAPLRVPILGRAPGDTSHTPVTLPQTFGETGLTKFVLGVRLHIWRSGLWIDSAAESGVSSSGVQQPGIMTATFASSHTTSSPIVLTLNDLNNSNASSLTNSVLLATDAANKLQIIEAEAMTATGYTSVADAANDARGGSHLRYTPTGTTFAASGVNTSIGSPSTAWRQFTVFAAVRNNSGTTSFRVRAVFQRGSGGPSITTPERLIDVSSTQPRIFFVGTAVNIETGDGTGGYNRFWVEIAASAASGTLDIDYFALIATNDERSAVIELPSLNLTLLSPNDDLRVDPKELDLARPTVVLLDAASPASVYPVEYRGDPWLSAISGSATEYSAIFLATQGASWVMVDGSSNPINLSITAKRDRGYLTPQ